MKGNLVVILGPTAVGKTDCSIKLAKALNAEIISADSRQFYKNIPIGTAQPNEQELAEVKHHFISFLELDQDYSVGDYEEQAITFLNTYFKDHQNAVAVGGSGLYIKSLCLGLDEFPDIPKEIVKSLEIRFQKEGLISLQEELREKDPHYFKEVDINNPQRLIRAIAVCIHTGKPFSKFRSNKKKERDFNIIKIGLNIERSALYDRINRRVDQMVDMGLENEVRAAIPWRKYNALNTVGYKEFFDCFDGKISKSEALELIKRNTRRFAKRQMTWFRKEEDVTWFKPQEYGQILSYVKTKIDNG
ncbi:MAG: tRNA (adenosine(37)-N6)-dimethylallyltransferase MiaA [Flavobacteriales bacterium]|nr:tRNA (adenosine(37)-N6)-dimethylallyltransferase MiaA [Flavobacteriales bacterium]